MLTVDHVASFIFALLCCVFLIPLGKPESFWPDCIEGWKEPWARSWRLDHSPGSAWTPCRSAPTNWRTLLVSCASPKPITRCQLYVYSSVPPVSWDPLISYLQLGPAYGRHQGWFAELNWIELELNWAKRQGETGLGRAPVVQNKDLDFILQGWGAQGEFQTWVTWRFGCHKYRGVEAS